MHLDFSFEKIFFENEKGNLIYKTRCGTQPEKITWQIKSSQKLKLKVVKYHGRKIVNMKFYFESESNNPGG